MPSLGCDQIQDLLEYNQIYRELAATAIPRPTLPCFIFVGYILMGSNSRNAVPGGLTTVGAKMLVAITGIALILFVIAHMLGNLQFHLGAEALDSYAKKLKDMGPLLWVARIGLLAVFVTHVGLTLVLTRRNSQARGTLASTEPQIRATGERYVNGYDYETATTASRFMVHTGLLILLFVIYHLMHFTIMPDPSIAHGKVHQMVQSGFQAPLTSAIYILAQLMLASHIYHGASSSLQTLGLRTDSTKAGVSKLGILVAIIVAVGNISIPAAVLAGWVPTS